ncbi:hypothetical protein ZYGR_0AV02200 [Zygosaccharomyces rouxii]|uniref:Uncharacterized protein n=1 Tax=Zygosaccharomyces rouxii TaxID=4956 RepID=A0A1Q3AIL5_ZYGRO|nr:hypothetical protein ZYGR_0AV02200 [Zygosaccharomyces rouxii]
MGAFEDDLLFQFSPEMPKISYREKNNASSFLPYTVPTMTADALKIPPPRVPQPTEVRDQRQFKLHELIQQRKKLEEMTNRYWLRDGEISESMFESSSDEEDN